MLLAASLNYYRKVAQAPMIETVLTRYCQAPRISTGVPIDCDTSGRWHMKSESCAVPSSSSVFRGTPWNAKTSSNFVIGGAHRFHPGS